MECAGDSRSTWKIINDVMNRNKSKDLNLSNNFDSNANDVANSFNNHFSSVGPMLAREIIQSDIDPLEYLGDRLMENCDFQLTNEQEVVKIVAGLNNAAAGSDEIPVTIIKK